MISITGYFLFSDKLKSPRTNRAGAFILTGNNLSSQAASSPVLSTRESLTAVFGMGTGGSSQPSSPDLGSLRTLKTLQKKLFTLQLTLSRNQALDLLVPVRSIHCCTYTPGLSTLSSARGLTNLRYERSHLRAGFTLRCFQRLSVPDVATQLYAWRHNWYTIGPSTPVLSY